MSGKKVKLRSKRLFSEEFKKARVQEYERGEYTVSQLGRLFKIHDTIIYRWIHKYSFYNKKSTILVEMKESSNKKLKDQEKRIAELERALGQKQMQIDFLEKMIDLAEGEYKVDIKKNSSTQPLPGSGKPNEKKE